MERDAQITRSRRPNAVEDDQTLDERPYSISPCLSRRESLSESLRKPKPSLTVWRLSFSR